MTSIDKPISKTECPSFCQGRGLSPQREIQLTFNDCKCHTNEGRPRAYRSYAQDLVDACRQKGVTDCPSSVGLGDVRVSGSGQFCWTRCGRWLSRELLRRSAHPIVIDLRMEAHGFLDGRPVSWFCPTNWERLGWEPSGLEPDEQERLQALGEQAEVYTRPDGSEQTLEHTTKLSVSAALTERQLIEVAGIRYVRLHVPDHCRPLDGEVDELVHLWDTLSADHWIHFHCKAGKGRTSTLMLLIDMLQNAHQVTLRDLIYRQYIIGLVDLASVDDKRHSYKYEPAVERLAFLQQFYEFARSRARKTCTWTQWRQQRVRTGPWRWWEQARQYFNAQWFRLLNGTAMRAYE